MPNYSKALAIADARISDLASEHVEFDFLDVRRIVKDMASALHNNKLVIIRVRGDSVTLEALRVVSL